MSIQYSVLSLAKFSLLIVIVDHWMACAWALIATENCDRKCLAAVAADPSNGAQAALVAGGQRTWLTAWTEGDAQAHATLTDAPYEPPTPHTIYTLAMYWAVMTLTSIGYGDVLPVTRAEYAWVTFFMLIGAVCWAYIIGSFCGVVATLDLHTTEFRQTMDELNQFMKRNGLPHPLRRELRSYFHQARSLQEARSSKRLLEIMSPTLKGTVAMHTVGSVLHHVPFLQGAEPAFIVALAQVMGSAVFAPNELLDEGDVMYHLVRGLAVLAGRVIASGTVWGDDMILSCDEYQTTGAVVAITFVEVRMLSKGDLNTVVQWFPEQKVRLRQAVVRLAVRRGVMLEAAARIKARRRERPGGAVEGLSSGRSLLRMHTQEDLERKQALGVRKRKQAAMEARRVSTAPMSKEEVMGIVAEVDKARENQRQNSLESFDGSSGGVSGDSAAPGASRRSSAPEYSGSPLAARPAGGRRASGSARARLGNGDAPQPQPEEDTPPLPLPPPHVLGARHQSLPEALQLVPGPASPRQHQPHQVQPLHPELLQAIDRIVRSCFVELGSGSLRGSGRGGDGLGEAAQARSHGPGGKAVEEDNGGDGGGVGEGVPGRCRDADVDSDSGKLRGDSFAGIVDAVVPEQGE
eukprot:g3452.t1